MSRVVLCVVGSQLKAWSYPSVDEHRAKEMIRAAVHLLHPDEIISGRSPGGGVDRWAEEVASELGYHQGDGFTPFVPTPAEWKRTGFAKFRPRDERMAEACTHLLAIRSLYSTTYGSGWTAERARAKGRCVHVTVW